MVATVEESAHFDAAVDDELAGIKRLAPDLAAQLWRVEDPRELPEEVRGAIVDVLGHECAERGLDADDEPNEYGRELDALVDSLGLDD